MKKLALTLLAGCMAYTMTVYGSEVPDLSDANLIQDATVSIIEGADAPTSIFIAGKQGEEEEADYEQDDAVSIIGGADGPTSVFIAGKWGEDTEADYVKTQDGMWSYLGMTYQYRLDLSGQLPNSGAEVTFVVLSNSDEITFEDVVLSLFSSESRNLFDSQETVIADILQEQQDETGFCSSLANPMEEMTPEELSEATGVLITAPEAEEVQFFCIWLDGQEPIAQMDCVLDGQEYCLRAQKTDELKDISGMYYEWTITNDAPTADILYGLYMTQEGQGIAIWYRDGYSFSVSMSEHASEEALDGAYRLLYGLWQAEREEG